jgi:hypothetical protein
MSAYPPPAPTYSDPNITASRFLKNPQFVARRVQDLSALRLIGPDLLKGRFEATGGAIGYETVDSMFADAAPETVAPGSEYTLTTIADGPAALAKVSKSGKDTLVTDEAIARRNMDPVEKGLRKLTNSGVLAVNGTVVSLIASAVTNNRAVSAIWTGSSAKVLQDILRAKASILGLNQGYDPNVLLVDDETWAYMASDPVVSAAMAREDKTNPIYSGRFEVIAGLEIIPAPAAYMPGGVGTSAWVLDTNQLGFIAPEDIGGGYQQAGEILQTKVMREDQNDGWRLRARSNFAAGVTDPGAGFKITGVRA